MPLAEPVIAARLFRDVNVGRPHVSASLDKLLGVLVEQLRARRGLVVLAGPSGSGKTIALRQLVMDAEPGIAARVVRATARATPDEVCEAVLQSLKAAPAVQDEPRQRRLRRHLASITTPYPALLVDDADVLSPAVRALLAELATPTEEGPALTILLATRQAPSALVGDANAAAKVAATFTMPRLSPNQVDHFIRARLRAAQLPTETFPGPVLELLSQRSEGLPGELMRLAGDALERAIGAGRAVLEPRDVAGGTTAPLPAPSSAAATDATPTFPAASEAEIEAALRLFAASQGENAATPEIAKAEPALPTLMIAPRPNPTAPEPSAAPAVASVPSATETGAKPVSWKRETFKVAVMAAATVAVAATLVGFLPRLLPSMTERIAERTAPERPAPTAAVAIEAPMAAIEVAPAGPAAPLVAEPDRGETAAARAADSAPAVPSAPAVEESASVAAGTVAAAPPSSGGAAAAEKITAADEAAARAAESAAAVPSAPAVEEKASAAPGTIASAPPSRGADAPEKVTAGAEAAARSAESAAAVSPGPAVEESASVALGTVASAPASRGADPPENVTAEDEVAARPAGSAAAVSPGPAVEESPSVALGAVASAPASGEAAAPEKITPEEVASAPDRANAGVPALPVEPEGSLATATAAPAAAASPSADPFDAAAMAELFREAEAAIDAAKRGGAGSGATAPHSGDRAIDPALRQAFDAFMKSIESTPGRAGPAPSSRQFEQFLKQTAGFPGLTESSGSAGPKVGGR